LGWPLIPDITSQLRLGATPGAARIAFADGVLAARNTAGPKDRWHPDAVLHIGGRSVSKRLRVLIRDAVPDLYILVRPDPSRFDPDHRVTHHVETVPSAFCSAMMKRLTEATFATSTDWTDQWTKADQAVETVFRAQLGGSQNGDRRENSAVSLNEPMLARMVTECIPDAHALVLASSMPVRDAHQFAAITGPSVPVYANRGASGIDGTLAMAAGLAVGRSGPVTCLIGDLATVHDLNSLALLQQAPVVVVLVNNSGGGIFHFLPIAEHEDVFESYFATPQAVDFSAGAAAFGVSYEAVESPSAFVAAYRSAAAEASTHGTSSVIEVRTDRNQNHAIHERLDALCDEAVRSVISNEQPERS
jgi:2-succinyl-5-enolpyruvyl-6-hydroxy-3-cyclohexene-1-carboxylate synthase